MTKEIEDVLDERLADALVKSAQHPFFIAVYGSTNYGTATKDSDIDTLTVIVPRMDDIIYGNRLVSQQTTYPGNEMNAIKDVRGYLDQLRKSNINFTETLFTDYYKCAESPWMENFLEELRGMRELVSHYDPYRAVMGAKGMLDKNADNVLYHADEGDVDGKSLANVVRLYDFVSKYLDGKPYAECLKPDNPERVIEVKTGHGISPAEARRIAEHKRDRVSTVVSHLENRGVNRDARKYLDDFETRFMTYYLKELFGK